MAIKSINVKVVTIGAEEITLEGMLRHVRAVKPRVGNKGTKANRQNQRLVLRH